MGVPWITDFMDSLGLSGPGSTFLRAWPGSVFFVYKNPILGGGRMSGSAENAREGGYLSYTQFVGSHSHTIRI